MNGKVFIVLAFVCGYIAVDDALVFAMGSNEHAGVLENVFQRVHLVDKHIPRTGSHEKLDATDALLVQVRNQPFIVVCRSEIEGVVGYTLLGGILKLVVQGFDRSRLWIGVGHIHIAGNTTGYGSHTFGMHISLVCQSWIAEVYMVVDDSWKDQMPAWLQ